MIKTKIIDNLIETYSDEGYKLLQIETGIVYDSSVIDVYPCRYTYKETDEKDEGDIDYVNNSN